MCFVLVLQLIFSLAGVQTLDNFLIHNYHHIDRIYLNHYENISLTRILQK